MRHHAVDSVVAGETHRLVQRVVVVVCVAVKTSRLGEEEYAVLGFVCVHVLYECDACGWVETGEADATLRREGVNGFRNLCGHARNFVVGLSVVLDFEVEVYGRCGVEQGVFEACQ